MPQPVRPVNRKGQSTPLYEVATTSGALAITLDPSCEFELIALKLHLSAGITAAENLTVTLDAGDGTAYDTVLHTEAFVSTVSNLTDIVIPFGDAYTFEADDKIVVSCPNSLAKTIGASLGYYEF